jgi:hypothetical protein
MRAHNGKDLQKESIETVLTMGLILENERKAFLTLSRGFR